MVEKFAKYNLAAIHFERERREIQKILTLKKATRILKMSFKKKKIIKKQCECVVYESNNQS